MVTRSGSRDNFGKTFANQLTAFPVVTGIATILMFSIGIIPGMPKLPFFLAAAAMGVLTYLLYKEENKKQELAIAMEEDEIVEMERKMKLLEEICYKELPL